MFRIAHFDLLANILAYGHEAAIYVDIPRELMLWLAPSLKSIQITANANPNPALINATTTFSVKLSATND